MPSQALTLHKPNHSQMTNSSIHHTLHRPKTSRSTKTTRPTRRLNFILTHTNYHSSTTDRIIPKHIRSGLDHSTYLTFLQIRTIPFKLLSPSTHDILLMLTLHRRHQALLSTKLLHKTMTTHHALPLHQLRLLRTMLRFRNTHDILYALMIRIHQHLHTILTGRIRNSIRIIITNL